MNRGIKLWALPCLLSATVAVGKIPDEYKKLVEYQRQVKIGAQFYDFAKINRGDSFQVLAFDEAGKVYPAAQIESLHLAQFKKLGKIHPTLGKLLAQNPKSKQVMVWLAVAPLKTLNRPEDPQNVDAALKELGELHRRNLAEFAAGKKSMLANLKLQQGELERDLPGSPFIIAKLDAARVKELSQNAAAKMFLAYDPAGRLDLATAMSIAGADTVVANVTQANGIKVAVFEGCPDDTTNLSISGSFSSSNGSTCSSSQHARHVTGMIRNNTATTGFAPSASTYSADSTDIAALDWAVDTIRVSALNQSFHRGAEIGDGLQADDLYKDYKVLHYPWPMIVHAAGNWCASGSSCFEGGSDVLSEFVNHKGFNTISVGNHNDTAAQMSASSCFVNPTSPHGDRELPEISANGTQVAAVGLTMSGTSMSSPATTGSVALLQKSRSVLKIWPEGVRALLFAGAGNVATHAGQTSGGGNAANAPNNWWEDVRNGRDAFDGAGSLNINRSVEIAKHRYSGGSLEQGFDIGTLRESSFENGMLKRTYTVKVSEGKKTMKVALAWNSAATVSGADPEEVYSSKLEMDLDLRVLDSGNNVVARSASWDNSYEVADFNVKPGETYTIKVRRYSTKPGAWSWYGIAWDVR